MEIFGVIYKVTNMINGKIYIGQTTQSFEARKSQHIYATRTGRYKKTTKDYLHFAMNKHNIGNFDWKIIEYCDSKEELDLAEEWYILYYKSYVGFSNSNGYNLTMGGSGNSGIIFSEEHRKNISKAHKGKKLSAEHIDRIKTAAGINPNFGMRGKKCSNETKEKLRQCNLGKKLSKETKLKISIAHTGREGNRGYRHTDEAKLKMSLSTSGELNPMYGIPSPMTGRVGNLNPLAKKYVITTPVGTEIFVYGLYNFCKNNKDLLHHGTLIKVAKGKQKQHKGYACRYYDETNDKAITEWAGI